MYDRRAILIRAWELHNRHFAARPWLKQRFNRSYFAHCFAVAWREAKDAAMAPAARRVETIMREIAALDFRPIRFDAETRRRVLEGALASAPHRGRPAIQNSRCGDEAN